MTCIFNYDLNYEHMNTYSIVSLIIIIVSATIQSNLGLEFKTVTVYQRLRYIVEDKVVNNADLTKYL